MRAALCLLAASLPALAFQKQVTTYGYDINGRRVDASANLNGGHTQLDEVQERVLEESAGRKVVERITIHRSPDGTPAGKDKTIIEEDRRSGGGGTIRSTTYTDNGNGRFVPADRTVQELTKSGDNVASETRVERPSINGNFELAERYVSSSTVAGENKEIQESTFFRDATGRWSEISRAVVRETKKGDVTSEQSDRYEPGSDGRLRLAIQSVASTTKNPDGSESRVVDVYSTGMDGVADGNKLAMKERRFFEKRTAADGSVVESLSVSLPINNNPNRLTEPKKVQETVCKGACAPPKP